MADTTPDITSLTAGTDYLQSLTKKKDAEKLSATFGSDGLNSTNATELGEGRKDQKIFTDKNVLGKDDFLMLLTTQLRYQDPMDPMKNEDYVAQLAQFSSLESMNNVETAITGMDDSFHKSLTVQTESADALKNSTQSIADALAAQNVSNLGLNNALTASLIGKDVRVKVDAVMMSRNSSGKVAPKRLFFHTDVPANDVKIKVTDGEGNVVRTLNTESVSKNTYFEDFDERSVVWDGTDDNGDYVKSGTYKLTIQAQVGNTAVNANLFEQGMVGGIDYGADGVKLQVKTKNYDNEGEFFVTTMPIGSIMAVREHAVED